MRTQVFCCAPDPDTRRQLAEAITHFGNNVLSTGNPRIATSVLQENRFDLLVIALPAVSLAFMSVIVECRRSTLGTPILVVFTDTENNSFPEGFADTVLCKPTAGALRHSVNSLLNRNKELAAAL